jgi:hypothetical protein
MDGFQFDTGFINYMVQCYRRYVTTSKDFYHWLWGVLFQIGSEVWTVE